MTLRHYFNLIYFSESMGEMMLNSLKIVFLCDFKLVLIHLISSIGTEFVHFLSKTAQSTVKLINHLKLNYRRKQL